MIVFFKLLIIKLIRGFKLGSLLTISIIWTSACEAAPQQKFTEATVETTTIMGSEEQLPSIFQEGVVRQWANDAEASSSYADPEWSAHQVIGLPDTEHCGDFQSAWASAGSDSVEWVALKYSTAVHVTTVNIVQSFNPNQVVKVELNNAHGDVLAIYEKAPIAVDQPCPYTLSIFIDQTSALYDAVRITVDQSILGLGWNEIDAVELIGVKE